MKKCKIEILAIMAILAFSASSAWATPGLWDWAFNVNGDFYDYQDGDNLVDVSGLDSTGFDFDDSTGDGTGIGTLSWDYTAAIAEDIFFISFFDHELNEEENTWYNEYGSTTNPLGSGYLAGGQTWSQSWEIDEPGYWFGDIYDNVDNGSLDNHDDGINSAGSADDVSMALGWDTHLLAGDSVSIAMTLTEDLTDIDTSLFYLTQVDSDYGETLYFQSALTITPNQTGGGGGGGGTEPVPEPATMLLMGTGLMGILGVSRRKRN